MTVSGYGVYRALHILSIPVACELLPAYASRIWPPRIFPLLQASLQNPHLPTDTTTRALNCPPGSLP